MAIPFCNSVKHNGALALALVVGGGVTVRLLGGWYSAPLEIVVDNNGKTDGVMRIWDAGLLDPYKTPILTQTVGIRNDSLVELHVARVQTDCGCLVVGDRPDTIASGQVGSLTLKYTVGVLPGPIQRAALVELVIGGEHLKAVIQMKGQIKALPILKCDPEFIDFGTVEEHVSASTRHVRVARLDGSPVEATDVIAVPPEAGVRCTVEESEGEALLTMTVGDANRRGTTEGIVKLHTLHAQHATLQIPFRLTRHFPGDDFVRCVAVSVTSESREVSVPLCYESSTPGLEHHITAVEYVGGGDVHVRWPTTFGQWRGSDLRR